MSSDATHLSADDEQRLTEAAGKIHAAMHAAPHDQPFLRALLADALEGVDRVRGRFTPVAAARPWPVGDPPSWDPWPFANDSDPDMRNMRPGPQT